MDCKGKKSSAINNKELLLLSLAKFYNEHDYINEITPIISSESAISLRLIDWFVTNFSKKYGTIITIKNGGCEATHFNVYLSYRAQLKAYSKQQFDPFRRRDRIVFYYDKTSSLETTIGQLNFFRWILQNHILSYIQDHVQMIENDMVLSQKENYSKRSDIENMKVKVVQNKDGDTIIQRRKKRNELSKSFVHNMNQFQGKTLISFE